ncbi:15207_t:CDS:2 [Gigaspora margarita]|uniref:15207_t:CDS:1 n=1 Tax=Gigaspora margarita TaxID=4874 RepID=A0ABM8W1U1_GIGMA|nr:15207_t:CDS:2 [Gigaspora margarita]
MHYDDQKGSLVAPEKLRIDFSLKAKRGISFIPEHTMQEDKNRHNQFCDMRINLFSKNVQL